MGPQCQSNIRNSANMTIDESWINESKIMIQWNETFFDMNMWCFQHPTGYKIKTKRNLPVSIFVFKKMWTSSFSFCKRNGNGSCKYANNIFLVSIFLSPQIELSFVLYVEVDSFFFNEKLTKSVTIFMFCYVLYIL